MKIRTPFIVLASVTLAFAGCSERRQAASFPKSNDLGVIDVSTSKPSVHTLADGRACTVTPTILPDGNASLAVKIDDANGSGETKVFQAPVDGRAYSFGFDNSTVITVALRK